MEKNKRNYLEDHIAFILELNSQLKETLEKDIMDVQKQIYQLTELMVVYLIKKITLYFVRGNLMTEKLGLPLMIAKKY